MHLLLSHDLVARSWGDAEGTILLMNRWQDDESIDELVVHRRVSDPVPSNL